MKRLKLRYLLFVKLLLLVVFCITTTAHAKEPVYRVLSFVEGVKNPCISLNGAWQFQFSPSGKWQPVNVPGELAMQGYAIEHDKPYTYRKTFMVPSDYSGKNVILRFDGVYCYARLSVNGKFVREHYGGFTRWETDITSFINPGRKNEIQVEITDRLDDISYASGYAHHPVGGILRDVTLLVVPNTHLTDFHAETLLDTLYKDARLKLGYTIANSKGVEIVYTLTDAGGKSISLPQTVFSVTEDGEQVNILEVKQPKKWDAEHPYLYTLNVSTRQNGKEISSFNVNIGFREVKIVGDRMLVNGKPVKLRGACRHDIHPVLGRTSTAETDSLDVLLFKESNMNFVRTSHYPPTEKFIEYCDRYGIYVECESAVCFVDTHRQKNYAPGKSQDDDEYTGRYLSQCREMVKTFRSHPSVLIWSIGNECVYGSNFQQCWDWVKSTDSTRPVIFSYPGSEKDKNNVYDILSMHYPYIDGNLSQWNMTTHRFQGHGIPALFDEWAHPACYTYQTLQIDPNIREFWGKSIDMMWSTLFDSPGGLGGAIWGYVDEIFMLPAPKMGQSWWKEFARTAKPENFQGNCVGYGEWGIVDIWRRKKPEFWATKKAYSPVRILSMEIPDYIPGQRIFLPVYNRFDHTVLDEIKAFVVYNDERKEIKLPATEPHKKGLLTIAGEDWKSGEKFIVEFLSKDNLLIDSCMITLGQEKIMLPEPAYQGKLSVEETGEYFTIKGNGFEVPFCKETGLICNAKSGNHVFIEKGPFLNMDVNLNHLTGAEVRNSARKYISADADWKKTGLTHGEKNGAIWVNVAGTYGPTALNLNITVFPEGQIVIDYQTQGEPNGYLREAGLRFYLPSSIGQLQWKRKGYWDCYPENDFAGNEGRISLYDSKQASYGEKPTQAWHLDTHNYFYWSDDGACSSRPLTQAAKGMKENIYNYTLLSEANKGFSVVSTNASVACRIDKLSDEQLVFYANNRWDYPEIAWGNYCKILENSPCFGKITIFIL